MTYSECHISPTCIWTWQFSGFVQLLSKYTTQYQGQMQILECQFFWRAILFTLQAVSKSTYWLDNFVSCAARQVLLLCEVQSTGWGSRLKVRILVQEDLITTNVTLVVLEFEILQRLCLRLVSLYRLPWFVSILLQFSVCMLQILRFAATMTKCIKTSGILWSSAEQFKYVFDNPWTPLPHLTTTQVWHSVHMGN